MRLLQEDSLEICQNHDLAHDDWTPLNGRRHGKIEEADAGPLFTSLNPYQALGFLRTAPRWSATSMPPDYLTK